MIVAHPKSVFRIRPAERARNARSVCRMTMGGSQSNAWR
jgi:hypothetical protein